MISIIIIVKNDIKVFNTIKSIINQKIRFKKEILVIDASDSNKEIVHAVFPNVRWIKYNGKSKKKGKSTIPEQRNLGIKEAKGDIIIFIDANCIADKKWLIELINSVKNENQLVVCGRVFPLNNNTINNINSSQIFGNNYVSECPTINLLISKKVINKVGLFDENLLFGSDIDYTWRIINSGFKIRYNSAAIVYHEWGSLGSEIKRSYIYGKSKAILYKKHTYKFIHPSRQDLITLYYPLVILLFPLIIITPVYLIFILIPILKNLNNKPFKNLFINMIYGIGFIKGIMVDKYSRNSG